MVKNIISDVLAQGYNYMKCTHQSDAPKLCRDAKSNPRKIGHSRFCPEPEADPYLICQLGKWYFSVLQQHEREMIGIDNFEKFHFNKFKFKLPELLQEAWESYKRCGNKCQRTQWQNLPFSADLAPGGFSLPTCVSDYITLDDFFKHEGKPNNLHSWGFPSVCGNFRSNETRGFMDALNAGFETKVYKNREPKLLWVDRIPRVSSLTVAFVCLFIVTNNLGRH